MVCENAAEMKEDGTSKRERNFAQNKNKIGRVGTDIVWKKRSTEKRP
jgi:hypothetical protein